MTIQFQNPNEMVKGKERNSKILDQTSDLIRFLEPIRQKCLAIPAKVDARTWHIELSKGRKDSEGAPTVLEKCRNLHGTFVDIDFNSFGIMANKAIVLWTPYVEGYGKTHTTIAYFRDGLTDEIRKEIFDFIQKSLKSYQQLDDTL